MDKLPVEVVTIIFEHLQDWDILNQSFRYITETSQNRYGDQYDGWLVHTAASRVDICNFRLMGRKYRSASLSAFGGILGHRIFRLTRVGLDDLEAICSVAALRPYIDTLSFGSAQFLDPAEIENLWVLLSEPDRSRIRAAYTDEYKWQIFHEHTELHQRFEIILNSLPKLRNLRLHPVDDVRPRKPLGGWLTDGDYPLIREAWDKPVSYLQGKCHTYKDDLSVFAPISSAVTSTEKKITDLRLAPPWCIKASYFYPAFNDTSIVSHLRFLRFDLEWRYLPPHPGPPLDELSKAFDYFANITHLTINMWRHSLTPDDQGRRKSLLQMLPSVKQLKQFTTGGHCHFHEDELVGFVARHSETLGTLALKRPIMTETNGSWASTTQRLLQMSFAALQYFELSEMRVCISHREFPPAFENATDWGEYLNATKEMMHSDSTLRLLSELEITTVRYVDATLRPPPTVKMSAQQRPSLPEHVLLSRERRRKRAETMQERARNRELNEQSQ